MDKVLKEISRWLWENSVDFVLKYTGGRGFNYHVFLSSPPRSPQSYVPLKILKYWKDMSKKRLEEEIVKLSQNPFEITRDFLRCFAEYLRVKGLPIVHDLSIKAFEPDVITIDAKSVKRRGYHRTFFSLRAREESIRVCLPVEKVDEWKNVIKISEHPEDVVKRKYEFEIQINFTEPSFMDDFLEEFEKRLFEKHYNSLLKRIKKIPRDVPRSNS